MPRLQSSASYLLDVLNRCTMGPFVTNNTCIKSKWYMKCRKRVAEAQSLCSGASERAFVPRISNKRLAGKNGEKRKHFGPTTK